MTCYKISRRDSCQESPTPCYQTPTPTCNKPMDTVYYVVEQQCPMGIRSHLYHVDDCGRTHSLGTVDHGERLHCNQRIKAQDGKEYVIKDTRYNGLESFAGKLYESYCVIVEPVMTHCYKPVEKIICLPDCQPKPVVYCQPLQVTPMYECQTPACPKEVKTIRVISEGHCRKQAPIGNSVPQYVQVMPSYC